jgi:hypothetical protein
MESHKTIILILALLVVVSGSGCSFFNDVNRLGADLDVGLGGGVLANAIGDVHVKGSLALERRDGNAKDTPAGGAGGDRGFL